MERREKESEEKRNKNTVEREMKRNETTFLFGFSG